MNTFNRMAAFAAFDSVAEGDQIFNLSDYLRLCILYSRPVDVRLADELALLHCYLDLMAGFRGWILEVPMTIAPGLADLRLPAHSTCQVAQALLNACVMETQGAWQMPVSVRQLPGGALEIMLSLRALSPQPLPQLLHVEQELARLCNVMSSTCRHWRYDAVCIEQSEIQVTVNVR